MATVIHRYTFSEGSGTAIADSVGTEDFDVFPSGALWTDEALEFSTNTLPLGEVTDLATGNYARTFSMWVKVPSGPTGFKTTFPVSHGPYSWVAFVDFDSGLVNTAAGYDAVGDGFNWDSDGDSFAVDEWHHIAISPDASNAHRIWIYLDGVKGSGVWALEGTGTASARNHLHIPGFQATSNDYQVLVDDVAVFDGLASDAEVTTEYNLGRSSTPPPPPDPTIAVQDGSATNKSGELDTVHNANPMTVGGADATGQFYGYWQFDNVPAGTHADGNLRLRVGPAGSGHESNATLYLYRAQATFDETTLTWNNKPALDASPIWSGAPFGTAGTEHNITIPAATMQTAAGGSLVLAMHSQNNSDYVRFHSSEDAVEGYRPKLTSVLAADAATYDLTITHAADSATVANRTYEIDATASVGATTLTQTGGATVSIVESPTKVFTFSDPGSGGDLRFDLDAGTETIAVSIPRLRGGPPLTFYGGDPADISNWG